MDQLFWFQVDGPVAGGHTLDQQLTYVLTLIYCSLVQIYMHERRGAIVLRNALLALGNLRHMPCAT